MTEYRCPHCGKADTLNHFTADGLYSYFCDPAEFGCGASGQLADSKEAALEAFCNPAETTKRIEQLTAERDELRAASERLQQLSVHGLSADQGGWTIEAATEMAGMFAASMAALLEALRAEGLAEFTPKWWKVTDKECGLDVDAVVRLVSMDAEKELELSGKCDGPAPHVCDPGVDYPCYLKSLAMRRDLEPCPCGKDDDQDDGEFPASLFSKDDMLASLVGDEGKRDQTRKQSLSWIVKMMNEEDQPYVFRSHCKTVSNMVGRCLCALEFFATESHCTTEDIEDGYNAARKRFNYIMTEGKV